MATSPLFGWEEPDDTDLVKDGAAAIRTLGNAIDTSMGDLLGGTTGQVLAKASNTNMDFTWVAQDDSNAIQNAIVDAKGDLIAATAADTPARLAVGTNGQVLTADSSASTGLAWSTPTAGMSNPMTTTGDTIYSSSGSTPARLAVGSSGQVLTVSGGVPTWAAAPAGTRTIAQIATGSLSGSSVTISSLSSYDDLFLSVWFVSGTAAQMRLRVNGSTSAVYEQQGNAGTTAESKRINFNGNSEFISYYSYRSVGSENAFLYRLTNCKNAGFTNVIGTGGYDNSSAAGAYENWQGVFKSAATVSSLVISPSTGTFSGGTYTLWGA